MAAQTFELTTTTISADPPAVIDFLMDLTRHRGLHPYVVSAEVVATGSDDDGAWSDWRVVERPRLGPFRYSIRFPARMLRSSETSMVGTVRAAPGCSLLTTTVAGLVDGQTVLTETTTVTAPRLVVGYMTSQARLAHARTYSLLPGQFAIDPGVPGGR
ncbi:hypothetical protein [Lacisediminihabitans profunda]|uniref:SRPBCC family protein n=1 Tax=Lacisediminihabitans profunda TaxID=2594790 RepID=A0A5C8UP91_9MICO|nr:hypothetical protein [Lacisediminihabitans profunda]TXN29347.1 hypothetical protein FVP33_14330 [Lacisediminihabitans profunda]